MGCGVASAEGIAVEVRDEGAVVFQADLAIDDGKANEADADAMNYKPGFALMTADEDLRKQMSQFDGFLRETDWAKAFRVLTDLTDDRLQSMVPMGGDGRHVLVKEELQRQLLSLPPEGRRAFRLYFDGQAGELLAQIKDHPLPGSEAQLLLAQALVDRFLATSLGGEAAALLGDLYFGRGLFDEAERAWALALREGSGDVSDEPTLLAKRALAMHRANKPAEARELFDGLRARYGDATLRIGGEAVDAIALLSELLEPADRVDELAETATPSASLLPEPGAKPAWHLTYLYQSERNAFNQIQNRSSFYSPPADLLKFVPPVAADEQRVYFQWLGVVIALDRQTGKIVWRDGDMKQTAQTAASRVQSSLGDPRNYDLAVGEDAVLVTAPLNLNANSPFVLRAFEAKTGRSLWSSDTRADWSLGDGESPQENNTTVRGEVVVADGAAYAVVSRSQQLQMYLRRFDPVTGEVAWTIELGTGEGIAFQYTQVVRRPQPSLKVGPTFLYVMTNNGAVLAIDRIAGEVKWAVRMEPPFGVGQPKSRRFSRGNQLGNQIEAMANVNGSGAMLLQGQTLYAKEHNSKTLYALDPVTGTVKWSADALKPDAKLIGVGEDRFFLMDRAIQSYALDGQRDLITKNGQSTGSPDHAGAIFADDRVLLYASNTLRVLDTTNLDPAGKYDNDDHLGPRGGMLYHFGDLIVAIDTERITAFRPTTPDN
jgi:outer membrane protein assembly factor BamB